jgi:hypothetical protein
MFAADPISIKLAHNSQRELATSLTLKQILATYDLHKYTFTRQIIIEERTMNHAFPVLTLNVFWADRPDELLSTLVHEQLHWYLREHDAQQKAAIMVQSGCPRPRTASTAPTATWWIAIWKFRPTAN